MNNVTFATSCAHGSTRCFKTCASYANICYNSWNDWTQANVYGSCSGRHNREYGYSTLETTYTTTLVRYSSTTAVAPVLVYSGSPSTYTFTTEGDAPGCKHPNSYITVTRTSDGHTVQEETPYCSQVKLTVSPRVYDSLKLLYMIKRPLASALLIHGAENQC